MDVTVGIKEQTYRPKLLRCLRKQRKSKCNTSKTYIRANSNIKDQTINPESIESEKGCVNVQVKYETQAPLSPNFQLNSNSEAIQNNFEQVDSPESPKVKFYSVFIHIISEQGHHIWPWLLPNIEQINDRVPWHVKSEVFTKNSTWWYADMYQH